MREEDLRQLSNHMSENWHSFPRFRNPNNIIHFVHYSTAHRKCPKSISDTMQLIFCEVTVFMLSLWKELKHEGKWWQKSQTFHEPCASIYQCYNKVWKTKKNMVQGRRLYFGVKIWMFFFYKGRRRIKIKYRNIEFFRFGLLHPTSNHTY